jgi:hypothetical protein
MKHAIISFSLLILAFGVKSQSLEKRIPKQTGFVICFDLNSLSQKVNFNDLGNYNFLKKSESAEYVDPSSLIKELFRMPEKAGLNPKSKMYIFSESHDSVNCLNYLFAITNEKLIQTRVIDILKSATYKPSFSKEGKMKVLNYDHQVSIGVGKDYALVSIWTKSYYYESDYEEYNLERNKVVMMIDSIRYSTMDVDTAVAAPEEEFIALPEAPADTVVAEQPVEPAKTEAPEVESTEEVVEEVYEYSDSTVAVDYAYDSYYDNDSLMKQFERRWVIKRKLDEEKFYLQQDKKMGLRQKQLNTLKPAESVSVNSDFIKVFANTSDIIYWFNYNSYANQLITAMSDKHYTYSYQSDTAAYNAKLRNPPPNTLAEFLNNNTMYGLGNFNKGELKMNFHSTFNDNLKPFIEKIYSNNINPEFFKYIKSDDLMGLMGFSINSEAAANLYYEIFRRASESSPTPNPYYIAFMEMTDLFLDKKVLYHTLKGDGVVAFTGIKSYLSTYINYEYDTLTFENREVEVTNTKYIPEFVTIFTIENLDNVNRVLKMIKRLDGLVELEKNIYAFKAKDKSINGKFFVVIKDNLLFVTNDSSLARTGIMGGMETSRTVGEAYKAYLNNTSFGFWDASKMFKLMAERPDEKAGNSDLLQKLSDKVNKGFFVTKPLVGNLSDSEVVIEMKNRENSSLLELLKLFDDVYAIQKFGF